MKRASAYAPQHPLLRIYTPIPIARRSCCRQSRRVAESRGAFRHGVGCVVLGRAARRPGEGRVPATGSRQRQHPLRRAPGVPGVGEAGGGRVADAASGGRGGRGAVAGEAGAYGESEGHRLQAFRSHRRHVGSPARPGADRSRPPGRPVLRESDRRGAHGAGGADGPHQPQRELVQ